MRLPTFRNLAANVTKRLLSLERSISKKGPLELPDDISDHHYIGALDDFYSQHKGRIDDCKVSVILPAYNRAGSICAAIDSIIAQSHRKVEILVCDDGSTDNTLEILRERYGDVQSVSIFPLDKSGVSAARNHALDAAKGDYVAFLDSDNTWTPEYLRRMITACISENADMAYSALVALDSEQQPKFFRGQEFDWDACRRKPFVDLNVYFYRKTAELDIRFDPKLRRMVDWDFILRQTKGKKVVFVPFIGCRYSHDMKDESRVTLKEKYIYASIVRARHGADELRPDTQIADSVRLSIGIKTPAPMNKAKEWGDYHYAVSLANSLAKLGHDTRIDFPEQWSDARSGRPDDIVIVIRGISSHEPRPGAFNVLWIISHADQVSYDELDRYDLVYTASESHARLLAHLTETPVRTLYQATDVSRFNPERRAAHLATDLLFVGNSRNVHRDMVRWAMEAGLKPSIYGARWEGFIPPDLVSGRNIANDRLGKYYASTQILLNDHWESMREFGLLSNRLFDGLACGAVVVSDAVPSLASIFGDGVVQVSSAAELRQALLHMPPDQKSRSEAVGRIVRERHSFDVRARIILDDVMRQVGFPGTERSFPGPFLHQNRPIRIGLVAASRGPRYQSSFYLRLLAPLTAEAAENRYDVRCFGPDRPEDAGMMDVTIVQRAVCEGTGQAERLVDSARGRGRRLVTDLDDGLLVMEADHPEHQVYQSRNEAIRVLMQGADESWFSTSQLQEVYRLDCAQSVVIQNRLDPRIWRNFKQQRRILEGETAQILYMGTATHGADFNLVLDQFDALHALAPNSFRLTVVGATRERPQRDWLSIVSPPSQHRMYPRFARWLVRNNGYDIGICPLVQTRFNDCKSDLKILDYAALGLVPVVSDCIPYTATATANGCAVVVPSRAGWTDALHGLIKDRDRGRAIAASATNYLWTQRHVSRSTAEIAERIAALV